MSRLDSPDPWVRAGWPNMDSDEEPSIQWLLDKGEYAWAARLLKDGDELPADVTGQDMLWLAAELSQHGLTVERENGKWFVVDPGRDTI